MATYVPGSALSQNEYVARMLENYAALYEKRSASALAAIHTPQAVRELRLALDSADARGYRTDVRRAIERAISQAAFAPFDGWLRDTTAVFGDTITVRRGTLAWDGDESVLLPGSPFSDKLLVDSFPDSLWFVAAGYRGNYTLSITKVGPQQDTQYAPLNIIALRAPREFAQARVVPTTSFPQIHFTVLGALPTDTTDYYRIETTGVLPITTTVESIGPSPVFLRWYQCAGSLALLAGPIPVMSGTIVNEQGSAVGSAPISVVGFGISTSTDTNGRFTLTTIPPMSSADLQVSATGFRPRVQRLQTGPDSVRISLVRTSTSDDRAQSHHALSTRIPAASCRILQVGVPSIGGPRIIRLLLTSP